MSGFSNKQKLASYKLIKRLCKNGRGSKFMILVKPILLKVDFKIEGCINVQSLAENDDQSGN